MNKLRRFLTIGVMAITVLATVGAYVPTSQASASAGDLIKMSGLSSVYYLGSDGKRYVFPNEATYMSWYNDFSGVVTITPSELQSYPLGGNVTMRAGTKLVKITTDPSVYAVEPNGVLRKIQSEAQAAALYGTNWSKRVVDVSDAFFTNYTIGSVLASGAVPAGSLVKNASVPATYYYDGSNYRLIADETAFNANRFSFANVLTITNNITAGGSNISSAELVNVAQNGATTGVVVTGSGLMVSLNSSTPAAVSVPKNGSRIPMAKVNLTAASDGAVTINSITVKRIGLSSYGDILKVWAEQNGTIIASKKTMNSNDESVLTFAPALTVNAGQTVAIDVLASLDNAVGNIGLSIASASAVSATAASVTGSFPINGNLMSPTDYNVTEVTMTGYASSASDVYVGDEAVQLGKFSVNFASSTRDITLKSVVFKNSGTEDISTTLSNVYLENSNGSKVATGVIVDKYITFTFLNSGLAMLKDNGDQTFYIKGDVIAKDIAGSSTIVLTLNKIDDFSANETTNGFGVIMKSSSVTVSNLSMKSSAVSVTKKSTSPSDTTVIRSTKSVVALLANVKADEAINADGLNINVDQLDKADSYSNVRVYVNSVLIDSFDPAVGTSTNLLESSVSLNAGNNEIKVLVDVASNASTSAKFQVSLNKTTKLLDAPEYVVSGNTVGADDMTGSATGAILTVAGATLSATRSDGYGSKTIVKGTTDISLGKFTVKATDDTVKITSIAVASSSGNTVSAANLYDFKLWVGGVQIGTTKDFTSTGANFTSLGLSVASNNTKTIELTGSTDNSATGTIAVSLTFTAEDSNGKAITGIQVPVSASFAVVDNGTLNIAKDGDSPISAILVSKTTEQAVAQFKLTATNDSANLTELVIVNASSTPGATSTLTTTDPRISAYKLYVEGNTTAIDTVTPFDGLAKFTISNNAIVVPADGSKKIIVKAVLNNIENDETATDAYLKVQINSYKFKSSNGDETPITLQSIAGNEFRIRKTAPTIALLALPNTTLTNGNQTVAKFTVSADSNADVKVSRIVLNYASSGVDSIATTSNPVKINGSAKTENVTSTFSTASSTITVDFGTSTPEIVSAGTSKTFEVIVNPTINVDAVRASFSTSMLEAAYSDAYGSSFSWTDSASNSDAKNIWFNSWRVKGLPSDTQTLTAN